MSDVTLIIGGREFKVACAEGEEGHIQRLGRMIDGKLTGTSLTSGQSEARTLLFAALLLADEVHDLRQTASAQAAAAVPPERLDAIAARLENLALLLDGQGPKA